jgi:predicted nucleic acid-binding protein
MEWLNRLQGQVIGLYTAPLIYFIESNESYLELVRLFFQGMSQGQFKVVTSTLTLTEVLVYPLRLGNKKLAKQYYDILTNQENLIILPVSVEIAEIAAQLRAVNNLRTPDAIQVATAIQQGARFFLTNDVRLASLSEIEILVLNNLLD